MNATTNPDFWNRQAARYSKKPIADEEAYAETLRRVRTHLKPEQRALELGCGTGTTALRLADATGSYRATDISEAMIRIAQEKAIAQGRSNLQFERGTLEDQLTRGETFDVVLAFNLLHLLPDHSKQLQHVSALLKPGGLFISKTPCLGDRSALLRLLIPALRAVGQAPYVSFVTEQQLSANLANAGFEMLETGYYPVETRSLFVVARKRG